MKKEYKYTEFTLLHNYVQMNCQACQTLSIFTIHRKLNCSVKTFNKFLIISLPTLLNQLINQKHCITLLNLRFNGQLYNVTVSESRLTRRWTILLRNTHSVFFCSHSYIYWNKCCYFFKLSCVFFSFWIPL